MAKKKQETPSEDTAADVLTSLPVWTCIVDGAEVPDTVDTCPVCGNLR